MDGSGAGEAGVLAWCNSIRFSLAKDPGREFLDMQIQKQGFDFLDSYLDDVFSRAKEDRPVYELLKTPGKKKDAPKRTRAATAAAAKIKALNTAALEESSAPASSSQESVLQSKNTEGSARPPRGTDKGTSHVKKKAQRIVTIVDTPEPPKPQKMNLDEDEDHDMFDDAPLSPTPAAHTKKSPHLPPVASPELPASTPTEHQRQKSPQLPSPSEEPAAKPPPEIIEAHVVESTVRETVEVSEALEVAEPDDPQDDMSIVEDTPEDNAIHTASAKELSMIVEADENGEHSRLSALPPPPASIPEVSPPEQDAIPLRDVPANPMDQDMTVPLRDGPSNPTLKRKPSATGFSGLPAPSPLRKSMRMSREPSAGVGILGLPQAHTPGSGLAGGKRTSWLTKAKEVKALELTVPGKRTGTFTPGPSGAIPRTGQSSATPSNSKPIGLGLGLPGLEPPPATDNHSPLEGKAPESEALAFLKKRKAASTEDMTGKFDFPQTARGQSSLPNNDTMVPIQDDDSEEGGLHKLRQTVQDARFGKSMGKSLGGNAAAELAAARAKAEAKVAQRNKAEGDDGDGDAMDIDDELPVAAVEKAQLVDDTRRLSVSDLVSAPEPQASATSAKKSSPKTVEQPKVEDISTSTTPPNSPPATTKPAAANPMPVFSKPPPVFAPPPAQASAGRASPPSLAQDIFKLPTTKPFSLPATTLGMGTSLGSPKSQNPPGLSQQSSKASFFSDGIFDEKDTIPPWVPPTQDTDYSLHNAQGSQPLDDLDDDDSWHMDDKFKSNQAWTPYGFGSAERDDTMTWSTLPSRSTSQKGGDTGHVFATATQNFAAEDIQKAANEALAKHAPPPPETQEEAAPVANEAEPAEDPDEAQADIDQQELGMDDMDIDDEYPGVDTELEDIVAAGKSTITLVKPSVPRAPSQQSMASTSSSQSQLGFFGQASRLVSSVLGGGKTKTKPEPVKSIARAAAAAKKQQEEAEKKATRMKEMEQRRQQAMQRKMEEEKARAQEEEKKMREEAERRKREREEHTGKVPVKAVVKKAEDDTTKKRKLNPETEKKAEPAKPPSKDAQSTRSIKPPSATPSAPGTASRPGTAFKPTHSKQASSSSIVASAAAGPSTHKAPASETKAGKIPTSTSNSKLAGMKGKAKATENDEPQPSKLVQGQMANRAKAQMQAQTPKQVPPVTSESIELPDINSEYSDSEDEDRPRTFDPPEWAQSPELRQQLEQQSQMNPDDIFGPIGPLRMEELFRTRQSRFRARTSSANWAGTDQLTADEEREYARRMGYK